MAKTGAVRIVNISSIMGFGGGASGHPAYSASKGAVRIYTEIGGGTAMAHWAFGSIGASRLYAANANATNANERADKMRSLRSGRLGEPIEVAYACCSSPPTRHRSHRTEL